MNRIDITRAAIVKVTQMLAGQNVKVTQRGDQAFVLWNKKTHEVERVNIPHLPDNASEELLDAVQGFLDHEVAHVLFTDPKARVDDKEPNAKKIDKIHNIVEDCWIEPKMVEAYRGSAVNLSSVRRVVFQKRIGEKVAQHLLMRGGRMSEAEAVGLLLVPMMRALAGHEECIEFMDEGDKWQFFPTILPQLKPYYGDAVAACENSYDTLTLARRVFDEITETSSMPEPEDQDEGEGASDPDPDADQEGEGEGGDEEGEGEGKDSDGEDADGDDSDGEGKGKGKGEESEGDEGKGKGKAELGPGEERDKGAADKIKDALDDVDDFEDIAKEEIEGELKKDIRDADGWAIFTSDFDRVEKYQVSSRFTPVWLSDLQNSVGTQIGPMQKSLERMLMAQKRSHYEPGRKTGRLNPSALHRLGTGDGRVFRKKHTTRMKNTAVQLVVDCSGSMVYAGGGQRLKLAFESAYGLAMTLERCRIPVQVSGYTTYDIPSEMKKEMKEAEQRLGIRYIGQYDVNLMLLFKTWQERMNSQVTSRFADMRHDPNGLVAENIDPIAIEWAARDLMRRQEERKVMMVLSDGFPAFKGGNIYPAHTRLKEVVKECERAGIETVGIGIQTNVGDFYPKNTVVRDVESLGSTMMQEMRKILLR